VVGSPSIVPWQLLDYLVDPQQNRWGYGNTETRDEGPPTSAPPPRSATVPPISWPTVWRSQAETESTARDASRQGGLMRMFAFVAVFISTLMLGFALNPDNRVELNRGFELLRTVGGWSYAPG
jgi:hypothetical protein